MDEPHKTMILLMMILTLVSSVEAADTETISKSILGGFAFFTALIIVYHCWLKTRRQREVMNKILTEEFAEEEKGGSYTANAADTEYLRSIIGVKLSGTTGAKVTIKDKRPYKGARRKSSFDSDDNVFP